MLGGQDIEEGNNQMEDGCREMMCEEVTFSVTVDVRNQICTEMIVTTRVIRITFFFFKLIFTGV